ncbi:hypothetical protein VTK73DRAFT_4430 [Phialemonium thermophilum]|uniref:Uncharacterized protein n=1 Tax=Phialemonium thermophilum TaxID=223376 RepID=A0ABR3VAM4_9PEZI
MYWSDPCFQKTSHRYQPHYSGVADQLLLTNALKKKSNKSLQCAASDLLLPLAIPPCAILLHPSLQSLLALELVLSASLLHRVPLPNASTAQREPRGGQTLRSLEPLPAALLGRQPPPTIRLDMGLLGISLIVASVVLVCLRSPTWLPALLRSWRQPRLGPPPPPPAETGTSDRPREAGDRATLREPPVANGPSKIDENGAAQQQQQQQQQQQPLTRPGERSRTNRPCAHLVALGHG